MTMDRRFVSLTRTMGQPWGINLKRDARENKFYVDSAAATGSANTLKHGDIIESINGVPMESIAPSGLKSFFDSFTTANIWYLRRTVTAPVINLLDDEEDLNANADRSFDNGSDLTGDLDDFDDDDGGEEIMSFNNPFLPGFGAMRRQSSTSYQFPRSNSSNNYPRPSSGGRDQPVIIDLVSSDDEPPPPPPSRTPSRPSQPPILSSSSRNVLPPAPSSSSSQTTANAAPSTPAASSSDNNNKSSAKKDTPRTHIGKIKIKLEFEPKQFGEANYGEEVVEVMPPEAAPPEPIDLDHGTASKGKRKFDDAFQNGTGNDDDDDEIQFVGGNMQVAADMPHQREACPRCPFQRFKNVPANSTFCPNCYCFICEIKASECLEWKEHCHAHCKDNKWKKLRDTSNMPILRLMAPTDKAAFLSKYRSTINAVEDSRYNDHDEYDSYDDEDDYDDYGYGYGYQSDRFSTTNTAFQESAGNAKKILLKPNLTDAEYIECTALLLNAIRLVNGPRCETVLELCLSWLSHPNFNQQYNDLLKQQLNRTSFYRLGWISGLADLIVKAKLTPNQTTPIQFPNEIYQIDERSFIQVIRKLADVISVNQLRSAIDRRQGGGGIVAELVMEYLRTQEKSLYPLVMEYLPSLSFDRLQQKLKASHASLQTRALLSLICDAMDSNRSRKSSSNTSTLYQTNQVMMVLFAFLLKNLMIKLSFADSIALIHRIINSSAISVLIQNPNLSIKTWSDNRLSTITGEGNESYEELELVLIIITMYLHELAKKLHTSLHSDLGDILSNLTIVTSESEVKSPIILANICVHWSLSTLCEQYDEASFHLGMLIAKSYFLNENKTFSLEAIDQFHPSILHELGRIPNVKFVNRSADISMLRSYRIELNLFRSNPAEAPITPPSTQFSDENQVLLVEYPSADVLYNDLFKPTQSSALQAWKVIGHYLSFVSAERLLRWISTLYYGKNVPVNEFLAKYSYLLEIIYKAVVMTIRKIAILQNERTPRFSDVKYFFNDLKEEDLFAFPKISACWFIVKTLKLRKSDDYTDIIKFSKKECNIFQNSFQSIVNRNESSPSSSQSNCDSTSNVETDLCKLFFVVYPVTDSLYKRNRFLWENIFKPYFNGCLCSKKQDTVNHSVNLATAILLENWHQIKQAAAGGTFQRLTQLTVDDLQWDEDTLVPNMLTVYSHCEEYLSKHSGTFAINSPTSLLARLFEYSNYARISFLVADKALIGFKLLAMAELSLLPTICSGSTDQRNLMDLSQRVNADLSLEIARKAFSKSKIGYVLYVLVVLQFLGQTDLASQYILPLVPERVQYGSDASISHYFISYSNEFDDFTEYVYFLILMNTPAVRLDGAMKTLFSRLQILLLKKPTPFSLKSFYQPIVERCKGIINDSNIHCSFKTYLTEFLFYCSYDEESLVDWFNLLQSCNTLSEEKKRERVNNLMQWLERVEVRGKEEKRNKASNSDSSSNVYSEEISKERYRTFHHYSILSHLQSPKGFFEMIITKYHQEKKAIEEFLKLNPKYLFSSSSTSSSSSPNIYAECEKLVLVAISKFGIIKSETDIVNQIISLYFDAILFLKNSSMLTRKQLLRAMSENCFLSIDTSILLQPFTHFCLLFLETYYQIVSEMKEKSESNTHKKVNSSSSELMIIDDDAMDVVVAEENNEITDKGNEMTSAMRLKNLFQNLSVQFPLIFHQYKNEMFHCFLFTEDPTSTFDLLLENRVYELIPYYLQKLEISFSSSKLQVLNNIDKITNNLKQLFQCIQLHHLLPNSSATSSRTTGEVANNNKFGTSSSPYCLEFMNNSESLLIQLFIYISEIQYRYLSRMNELKKGSYTYANDDDNLFDFHRQRCTLKDVIDQFINKMKGMIQQDFLLVSFLNCFANIFQHGKDFIGSYLGMKKEIINNNSSEQQNKYEKNDLILARLLSITNKRMFHYSVLEYIEMILDITISFPNLSQHLDFFAADERFRSQFINNLFVYPLMTEVECSYSWLDCSEKLLSEGFLSISVNTDNIQKLHAKKLLDIIDKFQTKATAYLGKGLMLYLTGYIPNELKKTGSLKFDMAPSSPPPLKADAEELSDSSSNFIVFDAEKLASLSMRGGYSEAFYCMDKSVSRDFRERTTSMRVDLDLMIIEAPQFSLISKITAELKSVVRRGYRINDSGIEDQALIKVLKTLLLKSAQKRGKVPKGHDPTADVIDLIKLPFSADRFVNLLKKHCENEDEMLPYLMTFLFAVIQNVLLLKAVVSYEMFQFALFCHRNNYFLPYISSGSSTASTSSSNKGNPYFDKELVQQIFSLNARKICNYFYCCYHSTLDEELISPSTWTGDQIIQLPPFLRMLTYADMKDASHDFSLTGIGRRRALYVMISREMKKSQNTANIKMFTELLLNALQELANYCKVHTMDKTKKSTLVDVIAAFKGCFQDLTNNNNDLRNLVFVKRAELMKIVKAKKPVQSIFEAL